MELTKRAQVRRRHAVVLARRQRARRAFVPSMKILTTFTTGTYTLNAPMYLLGNAEARGAT